MGFLAVFCYLVVMGVRLIKDNTELFERVFYIDVNNDTEDVHPPKCCHKCYALLLVPRKQTVS